MNLKCFEYMKSRDLVPFQDSIIETHTSVDGRTLYWRKRYLYIYKITNRKNKKSYIGISRMPFIRGFTHYGLLKNNNHTIRDFQDDFNLYGAEMFEFEILDKTFDAMEEKQYQEKYKSYRRDSGYNYKDNYFNPNRTKAKRNFKD